MIIEVKCPSGYIGKYEDSFKPGDIITTYQAGYHRFIKYEYRGKKEVPLIHYSRIADRFGKPCKSKTVHICDAAYCRFAEEDIDIKLKAFLAVKQLIIDNKNGKV